MSNHLSRTSGRTAPVLLRLPTCSTVYIIIKHASLTYQTEKRHLKLWQVSQQCRPSATQIAMSVEQVTHLVIWNDVVLSDIHHLSIPAHIKSLRTSLPGELRPAPHAPSPGWNAFNYYHYYHTWSDHWDQQACTATKYCSSRCNRELQYLSSGLGLNPRNPLGACRPPQQQANYPMTDPRAAAAAGKGGPDQASLGTAGKTPQPLPSQPPGGTRAPPGGIRAPPGLWPAANDTEDGQLQATTAFSSSTAGTAV